METSKGVTIASYILIGIMLIPIIAILLYVIIGVALFMILYIICRKKFGKSDPKEGKDYKTASSVIIIIGALIMVFAFKVDFRIVPNWDFSNINWIGYFYLQLLVFIGLIPMYIYFIKKLRGNREID